MPLLLKVRAAQHVFTARDWSRDLLSFVRYSQIFYQKMIFFKFVDVWIFQTMFFCES